MDTNESIEAMLAALYEAQMRIFRADCERVFAPLEDLAHDKDFGATNELIFAV
jgi:hypothetical protein